MINLFVLKRRLGLLLSLPFSIFFNFYYLPILQAVRLPIILYYPSFYALKGRIIINNSNVTFGMIRLGLLCTPIMRDKGISWMNEGGTVVFKGKCCLGAGSVIKIGSKGAYLEFGDKFGNASTVRIDCNYRIEFKDRVRVGWNVIIMDSNQHRLKYQSGKYVGNGYDKILIGSNNWISTNCMICQGTITPDFCVCASNSMLNKDYSNYPTYGMLAGIPANLKKQGIWRDIDDDEIIYKY